jgi:hypothetical protein
MARDYRGNVLATATVYAVGKCPVYRLLAPEFVDATKRDTIDTCGLPLMANDAVCALCMTAQSTDKGRPLYYV